MSYDPQRHHRRSIRLKGYDYSQQGLYFITLCCQNRACLFGEVKDGQMILNDAGKIVEEEWLKTPQIRQNTELGEFVVMPNHFHAILEIKYCVEGVLQYAPTENKFKSPSQTIGAIIRGFKGATTKRIKELINRENCDDQGDDTGVLQYAPTDTGELKYPRDTGELQSPPAIWQRNYWEHIIRNQQEYERIANYIIRNPKKWEADRLNKSS
jgi:REP element-mobilizing transposase RayT